MSNVDALTAVLSALAHPLRRRIVEETADAEVAAGDLARRLKCSASVLSQHLSVLESAGLVRRRAEWRATFISAEPKPLGDVIDWTESQTRAWNRRLKALKRILEEGSDA